MDPIRLLTYISKMEFKYKNDNRGRWNIDIDPNGAEIRAKIGGSNGGFSGGDMPHAWAAASYTTLVREMLISEHNDTLV